MVKLLKQSELNEEKTKNADEKLESSIDGIVVKVASLQKELNEEIKYLKKNLKV